MRLNILSMTVLASILFLFYAATELLVPVQTGNGNLEVQIPKGASFRQAVDLLAEKNLLRDKRIFILVGRLTGADRKIRAGYYPLRTGMNPLEILKVIRRGKIIEFELKILEGDSLPEIAEAFGRAGITTRERLLELASDRSLLSGHDIHGPSLEGYLYPDTYHIPKGMDAEEALDIMIAKMRQKFTDKIKSRMQALGMTENEVLTLASIIEKEAVIDSERPTISAVYHNRLKKNMLLQADPTAIYGVKSSKEKITLADLKRKTSYNTYANRGLPPGPIASPAEKSIIAALYPEDVPYVYFVAQDDRSHRFSTNEKEHAENVKLYRIKQQEMKKERHGN